MHDISARRERPEPGVVSPQVSVIVPVFNEERNLRELHQRVVRTLTDLAADFELIFVDDGSSDGTPAVLQGLASADRRIKVVVLSRNFNQHAGIAAGFAHARGQYMVLMDADLQDLPEEMPKLLHKATAGFDLVYGIREDRQDSLVRRLSAWAFFALFAACTGLRLPRGVSTYRVVSRRFADAFNSLAERNRFTAGMMAWLGFAVATVPIAHGERKHGQSHYSLRRLLRLSLDGLISFSDFPLRLASKVGLMLSFCSLLYGVYIVLHKLSTGIDAAGYASIITSIAFFSGVQLFFVGIIGEYLSRMYRDIQARPLFVVKETWNLPSAAQSSSATKQAA